VADAPHLDLNSGTLGDQHTGDRKSGEERKRALDSATSISEEEPDADISVTITGVNSGPTLSAGTANAAGDTYTLTPAQLAGLYLFSDGEVQTFTLNVTATTTDGGSTTTTASTSGTIGVTVTPVADAPHLDLNSGTLGDQHTATAAGNEDTHIALDITTSLSEVDADAVISVTITGVPAGATLSAGTLNNDGSYTLTPAQLSGLYLVSDGEVQS